MVTSKQQFIQFLKQNNAYELFIYYFRLNRKQSLPNFINRNDSDVYIDFAFTWDETNEGWEYWHTLHMKWNKYITNGK